MKLLYLVALNYVKYYNINKNKELILFWYFQIGHTFFCYIWIINTLFVIFE
jgi:hypothetical protein